MVKSSKFEYREKEAEEVIIKTSFVIINEVMYEQGYNPKTKQVYFIKEGNTESVNSDGSVNYHIYPEIKDEVGIIYKPINDEEIEKGVVLLPSHAHMFVDVEELIDKIKNHIHKYCDVSSDFEEFASYYVLLTYVYDFFNEIPYLSLQGDTGTGKSRVKNTIGMICYKPMLNNGGASSAAMYRITEKWKGTMVMDEADIKDSDEQNDVIKYLNCGFEKNSPIMKCDKEQPNKINFFNPYCPKIVARRQSWQDKATESRCITEITRTTSRGDINVNLNQNFYKDCLFLRNKLISFRLSNYKMYRQNDEEHMLKQGLDLIIEPRLRQTTNSILRLLLPYPEALMRFKAFMVRKQEEIIEERADSFDGEIINAIYRLLEEDKKTYFTAQEIANVINEDEIVEKFKRKAKSIGKRLKSLGIGKSKLVRVEGKPIRKFEPDYAKMPELYKKYVIDYNKSVTSVTFVTRHIDTAKNFIKVPVTFEPVHYSVVTNVTHVTNNKNETKINDYAIMAEFLKNNDFENNDLQLFEKFDNKLIELSLKNGLIFVYRPNWYKLL